MSRARHDGIKMHAAHRSLGGIVHARKDHMARGGIVKCADGGMVKGDSATMRADRPKRSSGGWIKGAIKHPGALKRSAAKAGESTHAFAEEHKGDSGKTGQRARLALTLGKLRPH